MRCQIGTRKGRLVVGLIDDRTTRNNKIRKYALCYCDCGNQKWILVDNLNKKNNSLSCGCLRKENGLKKRLRPFESKYNSLKRVAKRNKRVVSFSYEEYLDFTKVLTCFYCLNPIIWKPYIKHGNKENCGYNLDRKDVKKEYTIQNCVVCCPRCNWGKGDQFTFDEWYRMTEIFRVGINKGTEVNS